jgi:hypothetical protein
MKAISQAFVPQAFSEVGTGSAISLAQQKQQMCSTPIRTIRTALT